MKTVYTEKHKLRDAKTELHGGEFVAPFECPRRAEIILQAIKDRGLGEVIAPKEFGIDPVNAVHDEGFLNFSASCVDEWEKRGYKGEPLSNTWPTRTMNSPHIPRDIEGKLGYYALAGETTYARGSWEAALASKDVALTATELVLNGDPVAFGLCRPPGHHAAFDQFGGYCFLNNVAIAAQYARDRGRAKVAILDVDFHHGNGTQNIFYERSDVLFLSIHGDPFDTFPYFLGHADEIGAGEGRGYNVNYPLPPNTPYSVWRDALFQSFAEIKAFAPDLLLVSLGVDTFERDPISFFKLKSEDFFDYGKLIGELDLPTVYLMEGGYAVDEVGVNTVNVLKGHATSRCEY